MVEQILSYTGAQLGKKQYELEVLDAAEVVRQAVAAVATAAQAAGVTIEEQIPPDLPQFPGDSQAIQQAVVNLLANAIKYAAAGQWIGVSVRRAGDELEISVADRGPGIPAAEMKRIFEPFYRAASADPAVRGSGLGLTIVDQIARAHGGKATVASTSGRGSCFTLHLRIA
jgi:signal transduction histidine kinase